MKISERGFAPVVRTFDEEPIKEIDSASMKEEMMKLGKPIYEVVLRKHNQKGM